MTNTRSSIAFVVANYPPHSGGVQQHVQAVARRLVRRGFRTTVYCCEEPGQRFDQGVQVRGMGRHGEVGNVISFPDLSWWTKLSRELQRTTTTHVSVHTRFFPATWLGVLSGGRARIPVTLTEHGGGHVQTGSKPIQIASRFIDLSIGRWAVRQADNVTAVSERAASFTTDLSGRRPLVIPNGIDLEFWRPAQDRRNEKRLLFVGRLVPEKGWQSFLTILRSSPQKVSAHLVGDGPDVDLIHSAVKGYGLSNRVNVTGPLSRESLRSLYPGSVYVNPSTASEGCQTTLLEAAACGARIASYNVGGAIEVAKAGAPIEIVPTGDEQRITDAVQRLLVTEAVTPPNMSDFSWDHVVDQYLAVFTQ